MLLRLFRKCLTVFDLLFAASAASPPTVRFLFVHSSTSAMVAMLWSNRQIVFFSATTHLQGQGSYPCCGKSRPHLFRGQSIDDIRKEATNFIVHYAGSFKSPRLFNLTLPCDLTLRYRTKFSIIQHSVRAVGICGWHLGLPLQSFRSNIIQVESFGRRHHRIANWEPFCVSYIFYAARHGFAWPPQVPGPVASCMMRGCLKLNEESAQKAWSSKTNGPGF